MIGKEVYMGENMGTDYNPAHPSQNDPQETRIVGLVEKELLSTPKARESFGNARNILLNYFNSALGDIGNSAKIHEETQTVVRSISELFNSSIIEGVEYLDKMPGLPSFVVTNHLGSYKLTGIRPQELDIELHGVEVIHPFPMFYAPLYPIAEKLNAGLYEAGFPSAGDIAKIQEDAGNISIPSGKGTFEEIIERTKKATQDHPNGLFAIFPEGGTTGKRNNGGPYDLEKFHSGVFTIAGELGMPILPVAQYYNPNGGFELGVFEPIMPQKPTGNHSIDKERFGKVAELTQGKMQEWLNKRQNSS